MTNLYLGLALVLGLYVWAGIWLGDNYRRVRPASIADSLWSYVCAIAAGSVSLVMGDMESATGGLVAFAIAFLGVRAVLRASSAPDRLSLFGRLPIAGIEKFMPAVFVAAFALAGVLGAMGQTLFVSIGAAVLTAVCLLTERSRGTESQEGLAPVISSVASVTGMTEAEIWERAQVRKDGSIIVREPRPQTLALTRGVLVERIANTMPAYELGEIGPRYLLLNPISYENAARADTLCASQGTITSTETAAPAARRIELDDFGFEED